MITNQLNTNLYSIPSRSAVNALAEETIVGSANSMPTNNRLVTEVNVLRKPTNNVPPNYLKQIYLGNQRSGNGSLTESFIRSRSSFSPAYMHNEITTRYDMISAIPMKLAQIKKSFDKLA
jgi:hypothetical protein